MKEAANFVFAGMMVGVIATLLIAWAVYSVKQAREAREDRFRSLETWLYKVDRNNSLIEARLTSLEKGAK